MPWPARRNPKVRMFDKLVATPWFITTIATIGRPAALGPVFWLGQRPNMDGGLVYPLIPTFSRPFIVEGPHHTLKQKWSRGYFADLSKNNRVVPQFFSPKAGQSSDFWGPTPPSSGGPGRGSAAGGVGRAGTPGAIPETRSDFLGNSDPEAPKPKMEGGGPVWSSLKTRKKGNPQRRHLPSNGEHSKNHILTLFHVRKRASFVGWLTLKGALSTTQKITGQLGFGYKHLLVFRLDTIWGE